MLALVALLVAAGGALYLIARPNMGGVLEGARLARAAGSPQWRDGGFRNPRPRVDGRPGRMMRELLLGGSPFRAAARDRRPPRAVVISHEHYDHLDVPTVKALAERGVRWIVPLGVGAHLAAWGVPAARITELDWWGATPVAGLTVTATPARRFSGRGLGDRNRTLWAGWAFAGPTHRVFYSGDTALHGELAEIGRRLGPFDRTMIESGTGRRL